MTLLSPGVEITVIDESVYTPAPKGTVPFIVVATAEDKLTPSGSSVAPGTTLANAEKLWLITSQRELVNAFGNPTFYSPSGIPVHGYELNEYGLFAAYSALGTGQAAYIMRANIDLAALASTSTRPKSDPTNGTNWLDTSETQWGIFEWDAAAAPNGSFVAQSPIVITDLIYVETPTTVPKAQIGVPGDYAVVATDVENPVYYKDATGTWTHVGSVAWQNSRPTVLGTVASPTVIASDTIVTALFFT